MKTQVLQLDPHDDIISTRDKLGWKQTGRILLVWPRKGHVLTRRLDLVLLARHTASLGAQLALITRDPQVRDNASSLGISVFDSMDTAQRSRWDRPRHWRRHIDRHTQSIPELERLQEQAHPSYPDWLKRPAVRLGLFAVSVLAVLAIAAVLFPGAQIRLDPITESQSLTLDVEAASEVESVNISGLIPIHTTQVIVEGREQIAVTGTTRLPAQAATGEVTFTNLGVDALQIPQGTVVRSQGTSPVRFATTRSGALPAGANSSITLPVRALQPGTEGNLAARRLQAVEGPLGMNVSVSNLKPTSGGSSQAIPAPDQKDQQALYDRLYAALQQTALEEYHVSLQSPGDLLVTDEPQLKDVLDEEYTPAIGTPAETLELKLQLAFELPTVSGQDIDQLASSVLDANLSEGYSPVEGSLNIQHTTPPVLDADGKATWQMQLKRMIKANPNIDRSANLIMGLPVELARRELEDNLQLSQPPQITLAPRWWPRLPFLTFRIHFTTQD